MRKKVDVPHRKVELIVGLHDGEARARNVAGMAQGDEEATRQRGFSNAERTRKGDHVPRPHNSGKPGPERHRRLLVFKDHFELRGIVRVTVVPFPFLDTSSIVPPWASMN